MSNITDHHANISEKVMHSLNLNYGLARAVEAMQNHAMERFSDRTVDSRSPKIELSSFTLTESKLSLVYRIPNVDLKLKYIIERDGLSAPFIVRKVVTTTI